MIAADERIAMVDGHHATNGLWHDVHVVAQKREDACVMHNEKKKGWCNVHGPDRRVEYTMMEFLMMLLETSGSGLWR